ncbi:unnamed protein product [Effrenium voratum]|uniref:Aminoglycoside phosphotransferase domain-containing protein n=1 Tax=Effrenium voratum TaxID=2562239 RepID=A0AA36JIN8_9DINO|nr:unnamed protein product [Effrenium voratum]
MAVPILCLAHRDRIQKESVVTFPGLRAGGPSCACEVTEFCEPWQVCCAEDGAVQLAGTEKFLKVDRNLLLPGKVVVFDAKATRGKFLIWRCTKWLVNENGSLSPSASPELVCVYQKGYDAGIEALYVAGQMCQALPEPWHSCPGESFQIKEELGDGAAYKLEAKEGIPPICIHLQRAEGKADEAEMHRQEAIQDLLASKGLAPKRLASNKNFWLELWASKGAAGKADASNWKALASDREFIDKCGRLLARLHSVEPSWFEEHMAILKKQHPELKDVPASSHLWCDQSFHNKRHQFGREADLALGEQALKLYLEAGANPVSEFGSRIVTVHGDFMPSNILYTEDGLQLIDFETTSSGYAVADISYAFSIFVPKEVRSCFVRAYLEETTGTKAIPDDQVKALHLDGERCMMKYGSWVVSSYWGLQVLNGFPGALRHSITLHGKQSDTPLTMCDAYTDLCKLADEALDNPALAQDILDRGFEKVARRVVWKHGRAPIHVDDWPADYTGQLTWVAGFIMGCLYMVGYLK